MKDLESFTLEGCIVNDDLLRCLISGFKNLKTLELIDCHGFTNNILMMICLLLQNLEKLKIEGGEMLYNRTITKDGIGLFRQFDLKLKVNGFDAETFP